MGCSSAGRCAPTPASTRAGSTDACKRCRERRRLELGATSTALTGAAAAPAPAGAPALPPRRAGSCCLPLPAEARAYLACVFLRLSALRPLPPVRSEDSAVPGGPAMRHRTAPPARRRPASPAPPQRALPPVADAAGGQSGGRRKRSLASPAPIPRSAAAVLDASPSRRRHAPPSPVPVLQAMARAAVVLATVVRCAPDGAVVQHDAGGAACFDVGVGRPPRRYEWRGLRPEHHAPAWCPPSASATAHAKAERVELTRA